MFKPQSLFSRSLILQPATMFSASTVGFSTSTNSLLTTNALQNGVQRSYLLTQQTRNFSYDPHSNKDASESQTSIGKAQSAYEDIKPRLKTYLVLMALGTGIYFVVRAGLYIIEVFASINFLNVGEAAFLAGMTCALLLVGMTRIATRYLRLHPEDVYRNTVKRVLNEAKIQSEIGKNIETSNFRAYSFVDGGVRWKPEPEVEYNGFLDRWWKPRRLQMFFQVKGPSGSGMVSCEVEKDMKGVSRYIVLSFDSFETGNHILLEGDEGRSIYQGIIKLR